MNINAELSLQEQLKQELAMGLPFKRVVIPFDYDSGQLLGMKINEKCVITEIDQRPHTCRHSGICSKLVTLFVKSIKLVKDPDNFYQLLKTAEAPKTLHVDRLIPMKPVSSNRRRRLNLDTTTGDKFFTAYLTSTGTTKIEMTLKSDGRYVVVLGVAEGTAGYGLIDIGDIILDVDGAPVLDAEKAKILLNANLKKNNYVTCVTCRAMTMKGIQRVCNVLKYEILYDTLNPEMKLDAALIGRMEAMRLRKSFAKRRKGVYRKTKALRKEKVNRTREEGNGYRHRSRRCK
ncbi:unnamed protein product [Bursaphelenchus okinawaensis]|uniref:PDZ domain-containing protein n=1 Tax=Bursaphelenchus okinawaensis TaxID=465554 RepID=A0A811JS56_9BILA|nr:unnamed protein product [Bursaphelenchus okinawaensis]CAG9080097.1 unnamed protein product [Bursaphelenchus okinawaensis]